MLRNQDAANRVGVSPAGCVSVESRSELYGAFHSICLLLRTSFTKTKHGRAGAWMSVTERLSRSKGGIKKLWWRGCHSKEHSRIVGQEEDAVASKLTCPLMNDCRSSGIPPPSSSLPLKLFPLSLISLLDNAHHARHTSRSTLLQSVQFPLVCLSVCLSLSLSLLLSASLSLSPSLCLSVSLSLCLPHPMFHATIPVSSQTSLHKKRAAVTIPGASCRKTRKERVPSRRPAGIVACIPPLVCPSGLFLNIDLHACTWRLVALHHSSGAKASGCSAVRFAQWPSRCTLPMFGHDRGILVYVTFFQCA
jgi:hypothetical protein